VFELLGEEGYCDAGLSYHLYKGTDLRTYQYSIFTQKEAGKKRDVKSRIRPVKYST
jgi:hypothetical protein